jgi:hypothetical protein
MKENMSRKVLMNLKYILEIEGEKGRIRNKRRFAGVGKV